MATCVSVEEKRMKMSYIAIQKKTISIMICLLVCVSTYTHAQTQVDKTLDSAPNPIVSIEHINGTIDIKVWDKNQVKVTGTINEDALGWEFKRSGRHITIEVEHKSNISFWGNKSSKSSGEDNLVIMVPLTTEIDYEAVNGTLTVANISLGVTAEVVNGNINVSDTSGRHRLTTVNGKINAVNIQGDLELETVNGTIQAIHEGRGEVELSSVNGELKLTSDAQDISVSSVNADIELILQRVRELDIDTVNSSVNASLTLQSDGKVSASSVAANMTFEFQSAISARFMVEGYAGGQFTNKITDDKTQRDEYGPSRWLEFTAGEGDAKVDIETVSGQVILKTR